MNENEIEHYGKTFIAIPEVYGCQNCVFEDTDGCFETPVCSGHLRKDGRSVIWKEKNNEDECVMKRVND